MRPSTRFLSKLLGLYLLIVAAPMLLDAAGMAATVELFVHDRPAMLLLGLLCTGVGLALVLAHPFWSGGAATILVTLLGWMTLAKGVMSLALPPAAMATVAGAVIGPAWYHVSGAVVCILGAFLTYAGFRAPAIVPIK